MITAKAPGKLYIAGEYAVVEPGYPAIVVAVDQFVTVSINRAQKHGTINSKQYEEVPIVWQRQGHQLVIDNRDNPFEYILSSIKYTEQLALEKKRALCLFDLRVNSQLDSPDGKKFGLGSSAAVTVATVTALAKFYQLNLSKEEIFKLAAISHFMVQNNGSFGDIAASVYGGWIAYQSPDREWLLKMLQEKNLTQVLKMTWPKLKIESLNCPANLKLLIGWSGNPASTPLLVDEISHAHVNKQQSYQDFLTASKQCLQKMVHGFKIGSTQLITQQIKKNRALLQKLAQFSGVLIETPKLAQLCEIAQKHNVAAKSSGAGGGDCGIALADNNTSQQNDLLADWQQNDIIPLNFNVYFSKS
ncbi:phosphomevalonate kinase [Bombilactobacillus thymidiniphilus]|uniref:phosphomevalonate kinase n=1 Tax=Bombilactobacillus thymidiniphilus TaxID=2923363 RepID=A0ABY4PF50_9LACO|nr:phosphomevalonate kinase [Bombilactobacillus thymidiniphilus]UQS84386.1 phosphomevalonate kinase [Bombilactobacillus thymidiniphilus]